MALTWIREEWTVKFAPIVVPTFAGLLDRVAKIVGVSDDLDAVARCAKDAQQEFGQHVSAARSQPYYLDVTHPKANKGEVITVLSELLHVPGAKSRPLVICRTMCSCSGAAG